MRIRVFILLFCLSLCMSGFAVAQDDTRHRVIVLSDGEVDDECSMVRFLLYTNEWDVEAIVTTSSQYHWRGFKWAGDNWIEPYMKAYADVYPNLKKHDGRYPSPDYLRSRTVIGNVDAEGEMDKVTPGSELIARVLLDDTDRRPVWIQAWGGTNTLARALKTIEETYPERMSEVADRMRLFLIWEQDSTYQAYIRPHWGRYGVMTIISDQFLTYFYHWRKYLPQHEQGYLDSTWMRRNILGGHGALCSLYKARDNGDFRSEGDSPAFMHVIPTGLRSFENPSWGGWGGRYVPVRENTWLDPVHEPGYKYPQGRWYTSSAWGRERLRLNIKNDEMLQRYLKPTWMWVEALQNDFAARADWCVRSYADANHQPVVVLAHSADIKARPGSKVSLSAAGTSDPDGDSLTFSWWQYAEAGTYPGLAAISGSGAVSAVLTVPADARPGQTIHVVCEVTDNGTPRLTRYARVVVTVE